VAATGVDDRGICVVEVLVVAHEGGVSGVLDFVNTTGEFVPALSLALKYVGVRCAEGGPLLDERFLVDNIELVAGVLEVVVNALERAFGHVQTEGGGRGGVSGGVRSGVVVVYGFKRGNTERLLGLLVHVMKGYHVVVKVRGRPRFSRMGVGIATTGVVVLLCILGMPRVLLVFAIFDGGAKYTGFELLHGSGVHAFLADSENFFFAAERCEVVDTDLALTLDLNGFNSDGGSVLLSFLVVAREEIVVYTGALLVAEVLAFFVDDDVAIILGVFFVTSVTVTDVPAAVKFPVKLVTVENSGYVIALSVLDVHFQVLAGREGGVVGRLEGGDEAGRHAVVSEKKG